MFGEEIFHKEVLACENMTRMPNLLPQFNNDSNNNKSNNNNNNNNDNKIIKVIQGMSQELHLY